MAGGRAGDHRSDTRLTRHRLIGSGCRNKPDRQNPERSRIRINRVTITAVALAITATPLVFDQN